MGARNAVTRILTCDAPDCPTIVVPPIHRKTLRPGEREGRHLLLAFNVDAFAAARDAGWVTAQGKDFCPAHVGLAPRLRPVDNTVDVPLPDMPA